MLIARASGFAMFEAVISGNALSVATFLFPAENEAEVGRSSTSNPPIATSADLLAQNVDRWELADQLALQSTSARI